MGVNQKGRKIQLGSAAHFYTQEIGNYILGDSECKFKSLDLVIMEGLQNIQQFSKLPNTTVWLALWNSDKLRASICSLYSTYHNSITCLL